VVSTPSSTTLTYLQPGANASSATTSSSKIKLIQQITMAEGDTVPSGYGGQPQSTFVAYACIVTPVDDDNDTTTPDAWWGQVNLVPLAGTAAPAWTIGTTYTSSSPTYKVCRYTGDYNANGSGSNSEHPKYYRRVTGALDGQNFAVIRGDETCPNDLKVNYNGTASDLFNTNTVAHQPTAVTSYQCLSTSSCNGANKVDIEPASATTVMLMD
jgi:hypothetical protein